MILIPFIIIIYNTSYIENSAFSLHRLIRARAIYNESL